jgi:hypothetical protein
MRGFARKYKKTLYENSQNERKDPFPNPDHLLTKLAEGDLI